LNEGKDIHNRRNQFQRQLKNMTGKVSYNYFSNKFSATRFRQDSVVFINRFNSKT